MALGILALLISVYAFSIGAASGRVVWSRSFCRSPSILVLALRRAQRVRFVCFVCGAVLGATGGAAILLGAACRRSAVGTASLVHGEIPGRLIGPLSAIEAELLEWRCRDCQHLGGVSRSQVGGYMLLLPDCDKQCGTSPEIVELRATGQDKPWDS